MKSQVTFLSRFRRLLFNFLLAENLMQTVFSSALFKEGLQSLQFQYSSQFCTFAAETINLTANILISQVIDGESFSEKRNLGLTSLPKPCTTQFMLTARCSPL